MGTQIDRDKLYLDYMGYKRWLESADGQINNPRIISHAKICGSIGISRATMHRLFHTNKKVSLENVKRIADFIRQPLDNYLK